MQETIVERFWDRIKRTQTCWLWIGPGGRYGSLGFGENQMAHRFSWELHYGPIPEDLFVLHSCDTPRCVRPDHLFLGTQADNIADARRKGRLAVGNRHGMRKHPERRARGEHHGTRTHPESVNRGSSHYAAKLSEHDVIEIRNLREQGLLLKEIAMRFMVSRELVGNICRRTAWKHVP